MKVLVVDDERIIRDFFRRLLVAQGVEVTEAEDDYRAIELVKEKTFDICFLDVKMPGIDGLETYREIRKINQEISVVMMTGYAVEEILEQAKKEEVIASIYKPFDVSQVTTIISSIQQDKPKVKLRILVVDDDETILGFFAKILEKEKHSFKMAKTVAEAEKLAKEEEFDLVFLDIVLGDESGIKLYTKLRERHPQLQAIFMTAYPEKYEEAKKTIGISGCLYKPIEVEKILDIIKTLK